MNRIRHRSLAEKTYMKTKALLLNGRFVPGERLQHRELARELGVSLPPLVRRPSDSRAKAS